MSQIYTVDEVAEHFKIKPRLVKDMVRAGWPHIRINKSQIRFTADHLQQIEEMTSPLAVKVAGKKFDRQGRS